MTRIDDALHGAQRAFSLEICPPFRYRMFRQYRRTIDSMMEYGPLFVTVTYHQKRVAVIENDGQAQVVMQKDRSGPDLPAVGLRWKYPGIPTAPHFICGGFTKEETESALVQLPAFGIENVVCLRGDPVYGRSFIPHPGGHRHASELIAQVRAVAQGRYLNPLPQAEPFDFCIGFACYPESHCESPNLKEDIRWLRHKIDMGGDFMIAQMCFDNERILRFRDLLSQAGIRAPLVPGIKVISSLASLHGPSGIPSRFSVSIPQRLYEKAERLGTEDVVKLGQQWAIAQAQGLYREGFPDVHFYTLNNAAAVIPVLEGLGFRPEREPIEAQNANP